MAGENELSTEAVESFEGADPAMRPADSDELVLNLEGFEGPIDLLLALARDQKVDLTRISILALAEQYLSFIQEARRLRLEIAADFLVMAAWLAYLKSRLLLPASEDEGGEPSAEEMSAALAFQLRRLEAIREAGYRLFAGTLLGRDIFPRGAPEGIRVLTRSVYESTIFDLLQGYGAIQRRGRSGPLRISPSELYSMDDVLNRLRGMLGGAIEWATLMSFLPDSLGDGLVRRSAVASTLAASLELARAGQADLRQEMSFGPIYLRRRPEK